jgi:hypothetical protein
MALTATLEIFGNQCSCVATGTYGTTTPAAGTSESWVMGTGYTTFPTPQDSVFPNTFFRIVDPAAPSEIMAVVTGGGGSSSWTVIRGVEGTVVAHSALATYDMVISAGTLQNLKQASNAVTTPVTITTSTTETVLATYTPTANDLELGATFEALAFGSITAHGGTARGNLGFNLYWGGSGSAGGAFTSTGSTKLASLVQGTNMPLFTVTTVVAGASFDVNGQVTIQGLSAGVVTSAAANINCFYGPYNSSNSLVAASGMQSAVASNNGAAAASSGSAVTVSGASSTSPLILTAVWTSGFTVYGITATAPVIYRVA